MMTYTMKWDEANKIADYRDAAMQVRGAVLGVQTAQHGKCGQKTIERLCDDLWDFVERQQRMEALKEMAGKTHAGCDGIVAMATWRWYTDRYAKKGSDGRARRPHAGKLKDTALRAVVGEFHKRRIAEKAIYGMVKIRNGKKVIRNRFGSEPEEKKKAYEYWKTKVEAAKGSEGLLRESNLGDLEQVTRAVPLLITTDAATKLLARHGLKGERFALTGCIDYDVLMCAIKLWPRRATWPGWIEKEKKSAHFSWWIEAVETGIKTMLARGEAVHEEAETLKAAHAAHVARDEVRVTPADLATRQRLNARNDVRNALYKARAELECAQAEWDGMNASKGGTP